MLYNVTQSPIFLMYFSKQKSMFNKPKEENSYYMYSRDVGEKQMDMYMRKVLSSQFITVDHNSNTE